MTHCACENEASKADINEGTAILVILVLSEDKNIGKESAMR